jgi:hypothetical protein
MLTTKPIISDHLRGMQIISHTMKATQIMNQMLTKQSRVTWWPLNR